MRKTKHWVIQSGLRNAAPDVVEVATSQQEAVALAGRLFDLSELEQMRLDLFRYVYQDILTDGADYVELYDCNCASPYLHYRQVERRRIPEDWAPIITVSIV